MPTPLRFNLTLPRFHDEGERVPYRRTYEFAQHVESVGFHGGFVGHHSFTPETKDPAAVRAAGHDRGADRDAAARHRRLPRCAPPPDRRARAGEHARPDLGRTADARRGHRLPDLRVRQLPGADAHFGKRLDETFELWKKAWTSGSWEWDGRFFHFTDVPVYPPSVQSPHPPIYVGGNSDAAIDRATRIGDMWFTLPMETLEVVIEMCARSRAACARHGTEPRICLMPRRLGGRER